MAGEQHGVVSARQLARLGFGGNAASKAARSGRLHRVHRGVYAVGHRRLTWEGHCLAAVLAHEPAIASHTSAAWLWELLDSRPTSYEFTAAHRRRSTPGIRLHAGLLKRVDITERRGIPVTSVPRTLLDLAGRRRRSLPIDRLLHRTAELELLDRREVVRTSSAASSLSPKPPALPPPATNFNVGAYEIDCYWQDERFGVELDVYATHGSPLAFERDRERVDDLLAIGVEITRVTDVRLEREPSAVLARVAGHLERRRPPAIRAVERPGTGRESTP